MLNTITILFALLSTGFLAGILVGNRLGTSFALPQLPTSSFIQFQQVVHRNYVRFMPPLQIVSILSSLIWLYSIRNAPVGIRYFLLAAAAVGAVVVFAITLIVNVPVNKKLMTWNAATPPADARELWRPWDKGNTVRTVLAVAVFVLQVLAVSMSASTGA